MENLFDLKYGVAGVVVLLALLVANEARKVVEKYREKKDTKVDKDTDLLFEKIEHLEKRFDKIDGALTLLPKMKLDLTRAFIGIRSIAGDKWPNIREEILAEQRMREESKSNE